MDPDLILLKRYADQRDAEAFAELSRRHSALVYATSLRILGNSEDALEVAQDCFLKLATQAGSITTSVPAWLYRTARNAAFNERSAARTRKRYEQAAVAKQVEDADPHWRQIAPHLDEAIGELPEDLREVLVLRFLQGLSQAEVAERLGVDQSTVSRRLEKSLSDLRAKLAGASLSASVLAGLLLTQSTLQVPAALIATQGKLAVSALTAGQAKTLAFGTAKGATSAAAAKASFGLATYLVIAAVVSASAVAGWKFVRPAAPSALATSSLKASGTWTNATSNLGGENWGWGGVSVMAAVPGSVDMVAAVSEQGMWSSSDGGATWKKLGAADKIQIDNRPSQILFDPRDPAVFWESGSHGLGIFKTIDGGKSFERLGNLTDVSGMAIDFSDPERKLMLAGLRDQSCSLQLSQDGGRTWRKIGDRLPENSNFSTNPVILDARTFLINAAGWKQNSSWGIYRSEDAGESWTQVGPHGPQGPALLASDGTIFWRALWDSGFTRSTDRGKTWSAPSKGAVISNLIELPGGALAGVGGEQLYISEDHGGTWTKLGPPMPFKAIGVAFNAQARCFYAWQLTAKKERQAVVRLNVE